MTTIEQTLAVEAIETMVELAEAHWTHAATLWHEDGSATVVAIQEYDQETSNPREDDGNVATLVATGNRNFRDLDSDEIGLQEAMDHFEGYRYTEGYVLNEYPRARGSYWGESLLRKARSPHNDEYMVRRWLAIFHPEVVHFEPHWQVTGTSQSDWQSGYGYVLAEDMEKAGVMVSAEEAFNAEVDVYGKYFAGEVYEATHYTIGEPVVTLGDHGAYVSDYRVETQNVGGFLGYKRYSDIAASFTSSPVVDGDGMVA